MADISPLNPGGGSSGPQNNFVAIGSPAATNDASQGYSTGSQWLNANSGIRWICRDATTGAAVWVRADNADFFSYVAGRYYGDFGVAQIGTGSTMALGTMRLYPIIIKERHTIDALGIRPITTTAGGNAQAAQYRSDPSTRFPIGTPVAVSGNISTASAAVALSPLAAPVNIDVGLYWRAVQCDNATTTASGLTNTMPFAAQVIGSATETNVGGAVINLNYSYTGQTFGIWPDLTGVAPTELATSTVMSWYVHYRVSATF